MNNQRFTAAAVAGLLALAPRAGAAVQLAHHGRLLDESDKGVNATLDIAVGFHREEIEASDKYAQNLVWKCVHRSVQVVNGAYSLMIGSGEKPGQAGVACDPLTPALFDATEGRWMSISINGAPDLQPRLRLGFVPWALHAQDAKLFDGQPPSYYAAQAPAWLAGKTVPGALAVGGVIESTTGGVKFPDGTVQASAALPGGGLWSTSGADIASTNAGKVGIGTSTPAAKLDVAGTVRADDFEGGNTADWDAAYEERLRWDGAAAGLEAATGRASLGLGALATASAVAGGAGGPLTDATVTNDDLAAGAFPAITGVGTLGSLLVAGNVGIGVSSPSAALDVGGAGAIRVPMGTTAQRPANAVAGMVRLNTTTGQLEFYNGTSWFGVGGFFSATGGAEEDRDGYRIHTFKAGGTFTVNGSGVVEVLVVAGGGGGGFQVGGGGGAGGVIYNPAYPVSSGVMTVTVGGGGNGAPSTGTPAQNGGNSVFGTLTAIGGGAGANHDRSAGGFNGAGRPGGSGGGGAGDSNSQNGPGGAGTPGQGNNGGAGRASNWAGGGGGGAGAVGESSPSANVGGKGGDGLQFSISGTATYYGGGGGGCNNSAATPVPGGLGGGGAGTGDGNNNPSQRNGVANTGGGGGGVRDTSGPGGNGGSGIVIVRYPL